MFIIRIHLIVFFTIGAVDILLHNEQNQTGEGKF
jgi:hypothetical protein